MSSLTGIIVFVALPVLAQDGTGPTPKNAQVRSYGSGWTCDLGYRVDGADCLKLVVPENADATGRSSGTGWSCRHGYEEVSRTSCQPVVVPANAFLQSSGHDWQCEREYRKVGDAGPGRANEDWDQTREFQSH
ncbi:hypothetical protein ACFSYD_19070 [Paracoccus aerius]